MTTGPRPGWYPDPAGGDELFRWWDGRTWTGATSRVPLPGTPRDLPVTSKNLPGTPADLHDTPADLHDTPTNLPDAPTVLPGTPTHLPGTPTNLSGTPTNLSGTPTNPPSTPAKSGAEPAAPRRVDSDASDPGTRRRRSTPRLWLAVACGFALAVSATLGIGALVWREPGASAPATSTAGSPRPSAAAAQPSPGPLTGRLDESTGVAGIGPATLTFPGAPYELDDDPVAVTGFDAFFVADAPVHGLYDGVHTWSAAVALAHLDPASSATVALDQAGSMVLQQLSRQIFDGHPVTVLPAAPQEHAVDGHSGAMFTADVRYDIARLPSRFDRVSALVVRLDDGSFVAAISSVPDDSGGEVARLASRSLASLTLS